MNNKLITFFILWKNICLVLCVKFSAESFSDVSLLSKGKFRLESLTEKTNIPQYGLCWKNAISNLQTGCKFLSETIQSDIALKFTDCFLQMSGYEPLMCERPKSECLKKISDRAFNAYTEFYTHTQSICYFLQSQIWHEETEKTIDRLSITSKHVYHKLGEAERTQNKLLKYQKESLFLQNNLINNSKNVASSLEASHEKINSIMNDFQTSAAEQRKLLMELFERIVSLKSWIVNEMAWLSSTVFFVGAFLLSFLFTSIPRTQGARIFLFIIFGLNYFFERFLTSSIVFDSFYITKLFPSDALNDWIWLCRKFCICLSFILTLYTAFNYYDYSVLNYKLLLEIKSQNLKILNQLASQPNNNFSHSSKRDHLNENFTYQTNIKCNSVNKSEDSLLLGSSKNLKTFNDSLNSSKFYSNLISYRNSLNSYDVVDEIKNKNESFSNSEEKLNTSLENNHAYNLRSIRIRKN